MKTHPWDQKSRDQESGETKVLQGTKVLEQKSLRYQMSGSKSLEIKSPGNESPLLGHFYQFSHLG